MLNHIVNFGHIQSAFSIWGGRAIVGSRLILTRNFDALMFFPGKTSSDGRSPEPKQLIDRFSYDPEIENL